MALVAKAAGVSKNAVSLALRNDPQIPPATRARIAAVASELGYQRNPLVSELMARMRTSAQPAYRATLAMINAHQSEDAFTAHPTIPVYVKGCRARAGALGYRLDTFWLKDPEIDFLRLQTILETRGIRGFVIIGLMADNRVPEELLPLVDRVPCVVTGVRTRDPALHFACVDHHILALRTTRRAIELGYERPGLVIDPVIDGLVEGRFTSGFLLGQQSLRARERLPVHKLACDPEKARTAFLRWYEKRQPDVILSLYNTVTRWLAGAGVRIPHDVGFAQLEWRPESPHLAGMNQHNEECGAAAIDMLVSLIHGNEVGLPAYPKATLIGPTWVDGASLPTRITAA